MRVVICADDFGYALMFNKMILELIEEERVSATSVMVDSLTDEMQDQVMQLKWLKSKENVSIGLHLEFKSNDFHTEIERQWSRFKEIFGFTPDYLDLHKYGKLQEVYPIIAQEAAARDVACRNMSYHGKGVMPEGNYRTTAATFNGTGKPAVEVLELLENVGDADYLLFFHPGYYDSKSLSTLNKERESDAACIRTLDKELAKKGIEMIDFDKVQSRPFKI